MVIFNEQLSNIERIPKEKTFQSGCSTSAGISRKIPKISVTGVAVTSLTLSEQVELMVRWAKKGLSKIVCVANVHMLMESRTNLALRQVLASADLVAPDGMPVVWVMRSLGAQNQDRVAGMDIFEGVCQQCERESISIYLIGSTQKVLDKMICRLGEDFPQLRVAGVESPPFRALSQTENDAIAERVNSSGAGITFVSLGCPKQEQWMATHAGNIHSIMIGVGAVFPVYARVLQRAPKWVRENGLEWLYRWSQEPRRLSGRYLKTIPPFVFFALKQVQANKISQIFHPASETSTEANCSSFRKAK